MFHEILSCSSWDLPWTSSWCTERKENKNKNKNNNNNTCNTWSSKSNGKNNIFDYNFLIIKSLKQSLGDLLFLLRFFLLLLLLLLLLFSFSYIYIYIAVIQLFNNNLDTYIFRLYIYVHIIFQITMIFYL
jgi:hypothetical protein